MIEQLHHDDHATAETIGVIRRSVIEQIDVPGGLMVRWLDILERWDAALGQPCRIQMTSSSCFISGAVAG